MSAPTRSAVQSALAADRLGPASVASFALTAAAPLMVVGGLLVTGWATLEVVGIPLALVLIGAVLAVFCFGYVAMARRIPNAGAFYAYISQGLGRPAGVAAAFVAVLAYNALQFGLFGMFGAALSGFLESKGVLLGGEPIAWWAFALVAWAITALFGVLRVDVNSKLLLALLGAEFLIVIIYDVAFVSKPADGISFSAFAPDSLFVGGGAVAATLVIVVTAFIGFEAAPVFAEESRDARRTIPAATFAALGFMAVTYVVSLWAISVATGPANVVGAAAQGQDRLVFNLAGERLGAGFSDAGSVLLITSVFAAMLSFHNTCARYTFALAREGVLPRGLAKTGRRSGAPQTSSALQSGLSLVVIIVYAVTGLHPVTQMLFWGGALGGFGVVALLIATSLAVVVYFAKRVHTENVWSVLIAPLLAAAALSYVFFFVAKDFHNILGLPEGHSLAWIFPVSFLAIAVIGAVWALILRSIKPEVYQTIGLGAEATAAVDLPAPRASGHDAIDTDVDSDTPSVAQSPKVGS